jgi:hypothetical protein
MAITGDRATVEFREVHLSGDMAGTIEKEKTVELPAFALCSLPPDKVLTGGRAKRQ